MANHQSAFDRLDATSRRAVGWGFLWRSLVITLLSVLCGAVTGFIIGAVGAIVAIVMGVDTNGASFLWTVKILGGAAGFGMGLVLFWQYVRWIFKANLGGFRLQLVREPPDVA